jgi:hypothetical protein
MKLKTSSLPTRVYKGSQCQATGTNNIAIGVEAIVTSPSSNIILIGQSTNCNSGITNAIAIVSHSNFDSCDAEKLSLGSTIPRFLPRQ